LIELNSELILKYSQVYVPGSAGISFPDLLKSRQLAHTKALSGLNVFFGVDNELGHEYPWVMNGLRIYQEPALVFLCGINQPGIRLVLDCNAQSEQEKVILFLPRKDSSKEFWDGIRFGYPMGDDENEFNEKEQQFLEEAKLLTGISKILPIDKFESFMIEHATPVETQVFAFSQDCNENIDISAELVERDDKLIQARDHNVTKRIALEKFLSKGCGRPVVIQSNARVHYKLRLPLDSSRITDVEQAQDITELAFKETLKSLSTLKTENELACKLEYEMLKSAPSGLAFPSIVAGGKNACTLHYLKNDEALHSGDLVLLDFGCRVGTQHSDISRTIPVNGKFNPLQALLYQIVLDAQRLNEVAIKKGELISETSQKVWEFIEAELAEKFTAKGGKMIRSYTHKPHGVSHLMGEQEHDGDPFRLYQSSPLEEGWMLSNEPGLYGHFEMELAGVNYKEYIGIRLENDLLVTAEGCRNLSENIPIEIKDIEMWINKAL
jgi:Xaa-Pro aminopeptidase